ncbi:Protein VTS1 [Golovinomyces cichoracearum]|uniref:RNA-binding protein VTS1 n=1 Tax=Golovinomyces cichoracearum TaxID=62708 RepID=A0A420HDK2_9PEZI|nr:Protein VTS1 [Golovinomyces cichoracearum]
MLNMSTVGNRNSTPAETNSTSSLRPPSSRTISSGHHLRASADMAAFTLSPSTTRIRPSSDFYGSQISHSQTGSENDASDKIVQQWIADIDQYETTLEEMAAATLDLDFKDELSAIEQWFRVLTEAERTAALYALLQQTTQIQTRFFIQVLQQMGKNHPMSGVLSPANFDRDLMTNRLNDSMNKLSMDGSRNNHTRPPPTPSAKRHFGLDSSTINAMFPDAAAAIATEKAKFTQKTGNPPSSNHNNTSFESRTTLATPTISGPVDTLDNNNAQPPSPWGPRSIDQSATRPKSSSGQPPMGQFMQAPLSAGLRSPTTKITNNTNQNSTTYITQDTNHGDLPLLSPYNGNGNWASMVNTPLVNSFSNANSSTQVDMVANATAMKLAALSTVNNRFALDDVRKFRRAKSNDGNGQGPLNSGLPNTMPGANVVMINENGRVLLREQVMGAQVQSNAQYSNRRSRPNSPGMAMHLNGGYGQLGIASPQNNGYLTAYHGSSPGITNGSNNGVNNLNLGLGQFGLSGGHENNSSENNDMTRGRSPRGKRGSSKPPEDPTDPTLLQDIPSWLRSLRLHKYTENLKDMKWTELIELNDKDLEERGVNALGARRKMLKVFDQVKEAKAEGKLS